ncbi:MAG: metal-sensitive transcriptional regulator [Chloroflexota bacterium]
MDVELDTGTKDLLKRLRRVEGQVRGVQRMVEEDRDCADVLQQLSAIKSAIHQVSVVYARSYAKQCIADIENGHGEEGLVDHLMTVISKI